MKVSSVICAAVAGVGLAGAASAEETVFESFDGEAQTRWEYIADGVMGGVSTGRAAIADGTIRLSGEVSTRNNGGFIQAQRSLSDGLPAETSGLELEVRGNDEAYYVFVRTTEMSRPWYFYNVAFTASANWQTITIPLETLQRSHAHLREQIDPVEVISIGLVAYGRDYQADLQVREIRLY